MAPPRIIDREVLARNQKEEGKKQLKRLIEKFSNNVDTDYSEAEIRKEYLDKFFKCLGWDVDNDEGVADHYKDVVVEANVKIDGRNKKPDYSFCVGGEAVFFVEAKRPSLNLKTDPELAIQLKRYAWNARLPISIITDFQEFAVYNCTRRPSSHEKAEIGRIKYLRYEEYMENFDYLWDVFSKFSVWNGNLERFVKSDLSKTGTALVDDEFLKDMEDWRKSLATNIALRNSLLSIKELNICVQKVIDRILFLRICEDRNIEPADQLKGITTKNNIYSQLRDLFKNADDKYDSGLFEPNEIVSSIKIDDKILKKIILDLYYPKSPYNFAIISVDILGQVYEKFLGSQIVLTEKHRVQIIQKPLVKQSGGIYYTPKFVVDYIIKNTVGEFIKNKTPKQVEKIRILDPACGSGTFLVNAYECLLKYYLEYYTHDIHKHRKYIYKLKNGGWNLTTSIRKQILLNNIFGLDVDSYAVEITKLSLLLKVLENETKEVLQRQLINERALPNLNKNILAGNALIDSTIYDKNSPVRNSDKSIQKDANGKNIMKYSDEKYYEIRPFDWNNPTYGFGKILNGGFDIIIGNPPYVKEDVNKDIFHQVKDCQMSCYYMGKMDYWYLFTCKALDNLTKGGVHSFIATNNWITSYGAKILRKKILMDSKIEKYVDFNDYKVFKNASVQTMIFVLKKESIRDTYDIDYYKIKDPHLTIEELKTHLLCNIASDVKVENATVKFSKSALTDDSHIINFMNNAIFDIISKIKSKSNFSLLKKEIEIGMGITNETVKKKNLDTLNKKTTTSPMYKIGDGVFILTTEEKNQLELTNHELEIVKPFYESSQLDRYYGDGSASNTKWVLYMNDKNRKNISRFPQIKHHLDQFKKIMTADSAPYGLHRAKNSEFFDCDSIKILRKSKIPHFTLTDFPCYVSSTFYVVKTNRFDMVFLLGLFNSKLSHFIFYNLGKKQGEQLQIDKEPLLRFPIFYDKNSIHVQNIKNNTQEIIAHIKKLKQLSMQTDIDTENRYIDALVDKNNKEVYKLYEITDAEVDTIEQSLE